jgi:hypothetical protein
MMGGLLYRSDVMGFVLRLWTPATGHGRCRLLLAAGGVAAGALGALLCTRLLSGLLFQVHATDPFTYTLIAVLLTVTAAGRSDYGAAGRPTILDDR